MTCTSLTIALALSLTMGMTSPLSAQVELAWTGEVPPEAQTSLRCGGFSPVAPSIGEPTSGVVAAYELEGANGNRIRVSRWRDDGAVSWTHDLPAPTTLSTPAPSAIVHGVETLPNGTAVAVLTVGVDAFLWRFMADGTFAGESPLNLQIGGYGPREIHLAPVGSNGLLVAWLVDEFAMPIYSGRSSVARVNVLSGTIAWTHASPAIDMHDVAFSGDETFLVYHGGGSFCQKLIKK